MTLDDQNVSVTLKYHIQIARNTSKIIPQLISVVFSVCRDHTTCIYSKGNHEILAEIAIRQILLVSYLYSFTFKSAFKHTVLFTNSSQNERGVQCSTVTSSWGLHL